jgi:hypothetical protein
MTDYSLETADGVLIAARIGDVELYRRPLDGAVLVHITPGGTWLTKKHQRRLIHALQTAVTPYGDDRRQT